MRWLTIIAFLLALYPTAAKGDQVHVKSVSAGYEITTAKVAHVTGEINWKSLDKFQEEMLSTFAIPGDRLIVINSNGGSVQAGDMMIDAIKSEQKSGITVVCVVERMAHSMAFNLLTVCDVRLSQANAGMVVHKIEADLSNCTERLTVRYLQQVIESVKADDARFNPLNAKALNMSLKDYELYADHDHYFNAEELYLRRYLKGLALFENVP